MKKKLLTAVLGGVAMLAALSIPVAQKAMAAESVSVKTEYEYRLLGDTYEVQGKLVSATDPQGHTLPNDTKSVYLNWASGSYTFVYEKKTVKVKVYEEMPADHVACSFDMPTEAVAG